MFTCYSGLHNLFLKTPPFARLIAKTFVFQGIDLVITNGTRCSIAHWTVEHWTRALTALGEVN